MVCLFYSILVSFSCDDVDVAAGRQKWVADDEDQNGLGETVRSLQVVSEIE